MGNIDHDLKEGLPPIPVTILTGFLGAGKTTLLNRILNGNHGLKVAVLVNDFGSINIDAELVVGVESNVISLANGCICCSIRDDLVKTVMETINRPERPEYILLEASGVAEPSSIAVTFNNPSFRDRIRLDSILCVVDAEQVFAVPELMELKIFQMACADMVILNKVDLVGRDQIGKIKTWLDSCFHRYRLVEASHCNVPLPILLSVGRFDPARLDVNARPLEEGRCTDPNCRHEHHYRDHSKAFSTWSYETDRPLSPLVAYAVFGTSRQMVVAGTSASAVLLASTIIDLNPSDANAYYALAAGLILIIGFLFLVAGIFRLGFITQFLSRPVMEGFIFGLALFVSVSQMPKLFGLEKGEGNTVQQFLHIITHIGQSNWVTFAVGIGALILLFGLDRISRRIPGGLVALILGILLSALLNLSSYGVKVVGSIPAGLPSPGLPHIGALNTWILLPGAIGIVLVVFCESLGAANAFADKHGYEIKPDQDLFAFSAANLGSGLLGGLVAGGSMSQTAVNDGAGARSEVSTIVAAALGLITVIALTSLFYSLPEAVLAALIIHAVSHLMKVAEMQQFYQLQRTEFWLGMTALLGVILIEVLPGLMIAVVLSLVYVIYKSSRPHGSLLGKVPGVQGAYTDLERHPENSPIPGLIIFRLDSPLYFANASLVRERVKAMVRESKPSARALLFDMAVNDNLDITSAEILEKLVRDLEKDGIVVMFSHVHKPVLDMIRKFAHPEVFREERIFPTVDAGVQHYLER